MHREYVVEIGGREHEIRIERLAGGRVRLTRGGVTRELDARCVAERGRATTWSVVSPNGAARLIDVEGAAPDLSFTLGNLTVPLKVVDARLRGVGGRAGASAKKGPQAVSSPMPGKVVRVLVKVGDELKAGQGVAVVEAMKMENELKAPRDGKVTEVRVKEGQPVEASEILVSLD
jgi:biotin carboxyl carrier protein